MLSAEELAALQEVKRLEQALFRKRAELSLRRSRPEPRLSLDSLVEQVGRESSGGDSVGDVRAQRSR